MTRIIQSSEIAVASVEPLESVAAASRRFLDAVSGEVRRPMSSILAVAELLARQPLSSDSQAYVRTIIEHGQALLRSIDEAQDLVRSENEPLALELAPTQLHLLMDEIQAQWQPKAAQAGVALLASYDGEEMAAMIDPARVRQVFDHLIEHALRMTRKGGVEISLRARPTEGGVLIDASVRDSGIGLAPERLARIFEPGSGAAECDRGLGLAVSRRLIEAMNGSIRAESNIGAGCTIAFGLVAARAEADTAAQPAAEVPVRNAHVLVVDDNATNRMVAEALCEMFDCTSESAEDGVEAVAAAQSGRFDLILMDIKMPRMDGVQATRLIRELPGAVGQVPIIALTANADPEDARSYIASGMSCVVEKPIKAEALLAAMTDCLAERENDARACAA